MDFYVSGDVAPGGRFKFSYISTAENAAGDAPETDTAAPDTAEDTADVTDSPTDAPTDTPTAEPTETTLETGGCASALGLGSVLMAMAAAVALGKRKH